jgi:hypothetical protein
VQRGARRDRLALTGRESQPWLGLAVALRQAGVVGLMLGIAALNPSYLAVACHLGNRCAQSNLLHCPPCRTSEVGWAFNFR